MEFIKSIDHGCTEIYSYSFLNKNPDTYNFFINAINAIPKTEIVELALEDSNEVAKSKKRIYPIDIVFPMYNIEKCIIDKKTDLLHISVQYKKKAIEMIVNTKRFMLSMCMVKEDKHTLEEFAQMLEFAMRHAPKRGYWIKLTPHSEAVCSTCRKAPKHIFGELFSYCPHCGSQNERKDI